MSLARSYLLIYNTAQCMGWLWVLQRLLVAVSGGIPIYPSVQFPLQIFQTLGVLEVLHAVVGLVRASVPTTALQLSSRIFILWLIVERFAEVQYEFALTTMVLAWSLTEVPRYFYFAYCAQAKPPQTLVWIRYSTFLPLYPLGASSEWLVLYKALPYIAERAPFTVRLPNPWNFAFDFYIACIAILVAYLPGLPYMFSHMMHQRRKNLGKLVKRD